MRTTFGRMTALSGNMLSGNKKDKKITHTAKECAFFAVFVAVVIAVQMVFSFVPGVELVTVLFVSYAFVMGSKRGVLAATAFSLLRQFVFGFFPTVLVLYLVYYNLLALGFGLLGKRIQKPIKNLPLIVGLACVGTVIFTLTDNILTPIWYGYGARATKAYFLASIPFMIPQVICTAVSVASLFLPIWKVLRGVYQKL